MVVKRNEQTGREAGSIFTRLRRLLRAVRVVYSVERTYSGLSLARETQSKIRRRKPKFRRGRFQNGFSGHVRVFSPRTETRSGKYDPRAGGGFTHLIRSTRIAVPIRSRLGGENGKVY